MRAEYKRDMNHNYLILYGEDEINTDSYQVRMLVGNVIPSLLKCRIQGMDGRFLVYFDITSKQALSVLYEEKKMGVEDLRLIFGGFVKAMEDAAEYLMNPGQFIISPEYIYTDIEKQEIYFSAPESNPSSLSSVVPSAVSISIGTVSFCRRISRHKSNPLPSGSIMSEMMISCFS